MLLETLHISRQGGKDEISPQRLQDLFKCYEFDARIPTRPTSPAHSRFRVLAKAQVGEHVRCPYTRLTRVQLRILSVQRSTSKPILLPPQTFSVPRNARILPSRCYGSPRCLRCFSFPLCPRRVR